MPITRLTAAALDLAMCAAIYSVQRRHRLHAQSRAALAEYIRAGEAATRDSYFAAAPMADFHEDGDGNLRWQSPVPSGYPENDRPCVRVFPSGDWGAPTVFILHALMSASDTGYVKRARMFNARGWNAVFVHLPYHYSRVPAGHRNGELAITADLVRTGQGLRQAVCELRQLIAHFRERGVENFGVLAASYGGWVGALLASVEALRFTVLLEPIVDVHHAIWKSFPGLALRREMVRWGIEHELVEKHFHLISPLHARPRAAEGHVLLVAGLHDRIAPAAQVRRLHQHWAGSELIEVAQGHFGYRMLPAAWEWLIARGVI